MKSAPRGIVGFIETAPSAARIALVLWMIWCAMLALVMLAGCSSSSSQSEQSEFSTASLSPAQCEANAEIQKNLEKAQDSGYQIQPGDQLSIDFYLNPEFNDKVVVRPDGKIALRLVGQVEAAGLTPGALAENIDKAYSNELRDPGAVVHVEGMPSRQVYVAGEVTKPGAFPLEPGMTVLQAIADAGGFTPDAAGNSIVLIRRDACGNPQGSKVDMESAMAKPNMSDDVALMPRDMVVVPRTTISNVGLFVQHYIRNLLPIEPYAALPL